jgi:hypothetical protein
MTFAFLPAAANPRVRVWMFGQGTKRENTRVSFKAFVEIIFNATVPVFRHIASAETTQIQRQASVN